MTDVVVVTAVHDRSDHLVRQRRWLAQSTTAPMVHVVVVMGGPDPAEALDSDGPTVVRVDLPATPPLPLAAARNAGVALAWDLEPSLVVLLDVRVLPLPRLLHAYLEAASMHPEDVLLGPVRHLGRRTDPDGSFAWATARPDPRDPTGNDPAPLPVLDRPELLRSLSMAVGRSSWGRLDGFCEDYVGHGAEDVDLGRTAESLGIVRRWVPTAASLRQWHETDPPARRADDLVRNATLHHQRWGVWPMTDRLTELHASGHVHFDPTRDELRRLEDPEPATESVA